ncbi:MAG: putative toxin-antitoxin system toxin component, PIN family [Solirubrobacteraceae bacterium]
MKRVVLDANVLISALVGAPDAAPAVLLDAVHAHDLEMIACPTLIAEVRENLDAPYFRGLLDATEAEQAVVALERVAVMLPDPIDPESVLRDRDDDYLVALAKVGDAEAIVTGDKDLLEHADLRPPAVKPREAANRLAAPSSD